MAFQRLVAIADFLAKRAPGRNRKDFIGWEQTLVQNVEKFAPDIPCCADNCNPRGHDFQAPSCNPQAYGASLHHVQSLLPSCYV